MNIKVKSELTKERIVNVATKLFLSKGYEYATMQDIMDVTNLSKGALYYHFKSKQEILEFAMEEVQTELNQKLREVSLQKELSASMRLLNIIEFFIENTKRTVLAESRWEEKSPFALLHTLRNTINIIAPYIAEIIQQGTERNEFHCDQSREVAEVFVLLIDIWLDPLISSCSYIIACNRVDFIIEFLNKYGVPVIDSEKGTEIKKAVKNLYDEQV